MCLEEHLNNGGSARSGKFQNQVSSPSSSDAEVEEPDVLSEEERGRTMIRFPYSY